MNDVIFRKTITIAVPQIKAFHDGDLLLFGLNPDFDPDGNDCSTLTTTLRHQSSLQLSVSRYHITISWRVRYTAVRWVDYPDVCVA